MFYNHCKVRFNFKVIELLENFAWLFQSSLNGISLGINVGLVCQNLYCTFFALTSIACAVEKLTFMIDTVFMQIIPDP